MSPISSKENTFEPGFVEGFSEAIDDFVVFISE